MAVNRKVFRSQGFHWTAEVSRAFHLLLFLVSIHRISPEAGNDLFSDTVTVVSEEAPLFEGEEGRLKTLLILVEWSVRESAGKKEATGKVGDCGRMQLVLPAARDGHDCEEIKSSKDLDLRLGLRWMVEMKNFCGGNVRRGLAAYARGKCDSDEGLRIADSRMEEIKRALAK
jgi:hypothetical protein